MPATEDTPSRDSLLMEARRAAERAYAPYSRFRVGAAVVVATPAGPQIVTGANVENASYGLTLCAERSALASACALPRLTSAPTITHIAVACIDAGADAAASERMPCGACLQWFAELAPDATISVDGVAADFTLLDLLPHAFRLRQTSPDASAE